MSGEPSPGRSTRSAFLRTAAGAGAGLVLGGGGYGGYRLLGGARAGTPAPATTGGVPPVHRFHSRHDLVPPTLSVLQRSGPLAPGLLFMAPSTGPGQRGTLIIDDTGEPIWFRPSAPVSAMNFRAASYGGRPVLTWWEGKDTGGLARGTHVIADDHYRVLARVPAGNGLPSDLHEFLLTPQGTAFLTSWEIVPRDLRSLRGPRAGKVVGGVVQELELPSGRVLFEWHSLDHVSLEESHVRAGHRFDYFHVNSIAPTEDGNLIVSARNTWGIYKIDRGSGEVIWRLGGKRSDFRMGAGTLFAWQHDARPHGESLLSLFDDGSAPKVQPQSRGLVLALDTRRMRATLQRAYIHSPPLLAWALGSTQVLENGNVLVGYGTAPHLTEFSPDGKPLLDLMLPRHGQNYRALRFPWVGRPTDRPRLALYSTQLYVSWNGATEVASWQLLTGTGAETLAPALTRPRSGFETALPIPPGARYAAAVALDARGKPLARSDALRL